MDMVAEATDAVGAEAVASVEARYLDADRAAEAAREATRAAAEEWGRAVGRKRQLYALLTAMRRIKADTA